MKCPQCQYESPVQAVRCPHCLKTFEAARLEELSHLGYLRQRLEQWVAQGLLSPEAAGPMYRRIDQETGQLEVWLGLQGTAPTELEAPGSPVAAAAGPAGAHPQSPTESPPSAEPSIPKPSEPAASYLSWRDRMLASVLDGEHLQAGQVGSPPPSPGRAPAAAALPRVGPSAPSGPAFSWRQVGSYLLSERTLHALLALGTFLILASGAVISTVNPTRLDPLPHLGVVAATTVVFYAVGSLVLLKLRLVNTGETLLAIGGAFIPLNVFTLGQERLLNWEPAALWLAASLLCLPVYLGFHLLLRDRTFAALTALAGGSELLSMLNWLGLPLEWGLTALVGLALGYAALAARLRQEWDSLSRALFWAAQIAAPLVMALLLAAKLLPGVWEASTGRSTGGLFEYSVGASWWLGALFYSLCGRLFRKRRHRFLAAWTLPVAFLLTLTKMPWEAAWYNLCLALLAGGYLLFGRHGLRVPAGTRRLKPAAASCRELATEPVFQVAFFLTLVAALWPRPAPESQIATLFALSLVYGAAAFLLEQRAWAYASAYLLLPGCALALRTLGVDRDALPLAWVALSAALVLAAEVAARRSDEARRPLVETILGRGEWRSRFASPLFSAGHAAGLLALGLAMARYWSAPSLPGARDLHPQVILAFLGLVALWSLSAATRRTSLFLYPAAWLFIIPFTSAAALAYLSLGLPVSERVMARTLAALGVAYLGVAVAADAARGHYAKPLYLMGYLLSLATMFLASLDRAAHVQVVGLSLLIYAGSAWQVHRELHPSFLWVVRRLFSEPDSTAHRTARTLFLYLVAWLFPAWMLLAMTLWQPAPQAAHYGLALSLLGPLYLGLGLRFRRVRSEYRLPWYLGGYALSVAGPLVASPDPALRAVALALSIALYLASARVFRRSGWLYPVALLTPLLLVQGLELMGVESRYYGLAMVGLSLAYALAGAALHHGGFRQGLRPAVGGAGPFALPFLANGYLLAALGLGHVANQERSMVVAGFLLGSLVYAASAFTFRQSLFGHPAAWTLAVSYVAWMTLTPLEPRYYGLGLLPGIAACMVVAEMLRRGPGRQAPGGDAGMRGRGGAESSPHPNPLPRGEGRGGLPLPLRDGTGGLPLPLGEGRGEGRPSALGSRLSTLNPQSWLEAWATPFYATAYAGTVGLIFYSREDQGTLAAAWWAFAAVYGVSTVLFRNPGWLYPAIGGGLAAYLATLRLFAETPSFTGAMVALAVPVWVLFWGAHAISRQRFSAPANLASRSHSGWSLLVWASPWARPPLAWGAVMLLISALGSAVDAEAGLRTGIAYCLLLAIFAFLWRGEVEAWASLVFAAVVLQEWMRTAAVPFVDQPPRWAMLALALALAAIGARRLRSAAVEPWPNPLYQGSALLGVGAMLLALVIHSTLLSRWSLQSLAATTALSGLTLVAHGFYRRSRLPVYLGVALLEAGYMLQLLYFDVGQPQLFVLPAGLYLLVVGYLEWRRGTGGGVKQILELAALALLLGVSLLQAVGFLGAGFDRYFYDTFLFLESLALFGLGAALRWKRSFFAAILALVADVLILLSDPIRAMNTWYLVAATGLIMIGLVVFVEQRRQQIPLWIEEWRQRLETWD